MVPVKVAVAESLATDPVAVTVTPLGPDDGVNVRLAIVPVKVAV